MCLILIAHQAHPDLPLVVAANRDEHYQRPSAQARFWPEANHVLAGRDLEAGGTWLGLTRGGRFAAVTNIRNGGAATDATRSRGELVRDFLEGADDPFDYCQKVAAKAAEYRGFNLLVGDSQSLVYCDNLNRNVQRLAPGTYGLSNHLLDTPWPKVVKGKNRLSEQLASWREATPAHCEELLEMLTDREIAEDEFLPNTGVGLEAERLLSPIFIEGDQYGTCCSTAIIIDKQGQAFFHERSFYGGKIRDARHQFRVESAQAG